MMYQAEENKWASGISKQVETTGHPPSIVYRLEPIHRRFLDWFGLAPALRHSPSMLKSPDQKVKFTIVLSSSLVTVSFALVAAPSVCVWESSVAWRMSCSSCFLSSN